MKKAILSRVQHQILHKPSKECPLGLCGEVLNDAGNSFGRNWNASSADSHYITWPISWKEKDFTEL